MRRDAKNDTTNTDVEIYKACNRKKLIVNFIFSFELEILISWAVLQNLSSTIITIDSDEVNKHTYLLLKSLI